MWRAMKILILGLGSASTHLAVLTVMELPSWKLGVVEAYTSSTPSCLLSSYWGDGLCDGDLNSAECEYDGGDCCWCTCVDSYYSCGDIGYDCQDPSVNCQLDDCSGFVEFIADGDCDDLNNNANCGYDGGDCCPCTCSNGTYVCGDSGYDCQDPSVVCHTSSPTSGDYEDCDGFLNMIADGYCDPQTNNLDCGWDGGDCCPCTCENGTFTCGAEIPYNCLDPNGACATPSPIAAVYPDCAAGSVSLIGDGSCDSSTNNADCGYDGGDCCPCTCVDSQYTCGTNEYDCLDPVSDCATPSPISGLYSDCDGSVSLIGDGGCDSFTNNADCGYDGGDCCTCTCVDGDFTCGTKGYDCRDPSSDCSTSSLTSSGYQNCNGVVGLIGDGDCDSSNNNADCGYDGGDCCSCTCVDGEYTCGTNGYDCQDPSSDCNTPSPVGGNYPNCGGSVPLIANGYCTFINNNAGCGYDGGDCCSCTCVDGEFTCGLGGYECQDPSVDCTAGSTTPGAGSTSGEEDRFSFSTLVVGCMVASGTLVIVAAVALCFCFIFKRPRVEEGPRISGSQRIVPHGSPVLATAAIPPPHSVPLVPTAVLAPTNAAAAGPNDRVHAKATTITITAPAPTTAQPLPPPSLRPSAPPPSYFSSAHVVRAGFR